MPIVVWDLFFVDLLVDLLSMPARMRGRNGRARRAVDGTSLTLVITVVDTAQEGRPAARP